MTIKTWSYSRLTTFEKCKFWAKLAYIDKIPEPERPLPKGKTEHANDRGDRIHKAAELYVKSSPPILLIPELVAFETELNKLRDLYAEGRVSIEEEWAMDINWEPCAWGSDTAWLRLKLDAMVLLDPGHIAVIDHKTGKLFGNEIKHGEQCQLYAIVCFMRYPDVQKVTAELWYIDQDEITTVTYTRKQAARLLDTFHKRGEAMTTCSDFRPNPNIISCKYCPYSYKGTGHCEKGV